MASRSITCRSRRLRQIIDLRDSGKSWYFVITEFNNCFHILITSWQLREAICHFSFENVVSITHEQNIICRKTRLDGTTHEQTIICRQLVAGHVVDSRPMERKKETHRMIKQLLNSVITKYCDLSVSRWSIIYLRLWLHQIVNLFSTDKSWYFAQHHPITVIYFPANHVHVYPVN